MFEICSKKECTACFACVNICGQSCIHMQEDSDGSLYPVIDNDKCVNCSRCKKVCPANNDVLLSLPKTAYAAYSMDKNTQKKATSGGIAAELARQTVEMGGVVFASSMDSELDVSFKKITLKEELESIRGSKYVHSHINYTLRDIKKELDSKKTVLFIGTPCQVAGVKRYLGDNDYADFYCADLVCHGVPSSYVFKSYSKGYLKNKFNDAVSASFRDKNDYVLRYYDKNGDVIASSYWLENPFLLSFLEGTILRENCHFCKYAKSKRAGDITLGDFWGISDNLIGEENVKNGINAVLINTEKGKKLFEKIKPYLEFKKCSVDEIVQGNTQLRKPCEDTESAQKFRKLCKTKSVSTAIKYCNLKKYLLCRVRTHLYKNEKLFSFIRKIPYIKEKI